MENTTYTKVITYDDIVPKQIFFGDSITSAENNHYDGFVAKLGWHSNYGVSGTTIGDYSLYPVGNTDLCAQIEQHTEAVQCANKIFLEYGSNDISSIVAGYATFNQVCISLIKAVDHIKQINPSAKIYFIALGNANVKRFAQGQCDYLSNEYLKALDRYLNIDVNTWMQLYYNFLDVVSKIMPILYLSIDPLTDEQMDTDKIHPNDAGYQFIAKQLEKQMKEISK